MRSSRFNIFKEKNKLKKPPKEYLRLVWKIILAIFFTFMFLLTLTGCVQSFALSNGSGLSNGPEVIQKKEHQNPRFVKIDVFKEVEEKNKKKTILDLNPTLDKTFLDWKNAKHKKLLDKYHDKVSSETGGSFENATYGVNAIIKVGEDEILLSWRPVDKDYKFDETLISSLNQKISENKLNKLKKHHRLKFKFDFKDENFSGHHDDWKLLINNRDVLKENKKHILYTKYQLLKKIINEYKQNLDINDNDLTCDTTYDNNEKILVLNLFYNYKKLKMANDKDKHLSRSYGFAKLLVEIKKILSIDFSKNYIK
ncbi:MAG: hypothetical protein E7Y34_01735, partial [Mycoplasma sp.]|nr:hypothetical protein [Mycoplasma sp.]